MSVDANPVYAILRNALMRMPEDAPFRGPKKCIDGDLTYVNSWHGTIEHYSGKEQITLEEKVLYKANYRGGLVDQKIGV